MRSSYKSPASEKYPTQHPIPPSLSHFPPPSAPSSQYYPGQVYRPPTRPTKEFSYTSDPSFQQDQTSPRPLLYKTKFDSGKRGKVKPGKHRYPSDRIDKFPLNMSLPATEHSNETSPSLSFQQLRGLSLGQFRSKMPQLRTSTLYYDMVIQPRLKIPGEFEKRLKYLAYGREGIRSLVKQKFQAFKIDLGKRINEGNSILIGDTGGIDCLPVKKPKTAEHQRRAVVSYHLRQMKRPASMQKSRKNSNATQQSGETGSIGTGPYKMNSQFAGKRLSNSEVRLSQDSVPFSLKKGRNEIQNMRKTQQTPDSDVQRKKTSSKLKWSKNLHSSFQVIREGKGKNLVNLSYSTKRGAEMYKSREIEISSIQKAKMLLKNGIGIQLANNALKNSPNMSSKGGAQDTQGGRLLTQTLGSKVFKKTVNISDFKILNTFAWGGFSVLQRIQILNKSKFQNEEDKREFFAIKVISKLRILDNKKVMAGIVNEKNILRQLYNENFFPKLYTSFQDEKGLYMVMDLIGGGRISSHFHTNIKFTYPVLQFYISEIILALQILHSRHIIYRDLKPENVLISNQGHIKLVDFNLSKKLDSSKTYTLCGTPHYLAPQIITRAGYGISADIWSLGVMIFEFWTGKTPFDARNPQDIFRNILKLKINWQGTLDGRTRLLIKKLLTPDPTLRPTIEEVKQQKAFDGVEWEEMASLQIPPPFVPDPTIYKEYIQKELGIPQRLFSSIDRVQTGKHEMTSAYQQRQMEKTKEYFKQF